MKLHFSVLIGSTLRNTSVPSSTAIWHYSCLLLCVIAQTSTVTGVQSQNYHYRDVLKILICLEPEVGFFAEHYELA